MKALIMSDTHDNTKIVDKIAKIFKEKKVFSFIHCGDVTGPKMVRALKEAGLTNGFFVQGNMDEANLKELKEAINESGFDFLGENSEMKLGDTEKNDVILIYITHGNNENSLMKAIESGKFDFVVYGHTHKKSVKTEGKTCIINVGALCEDVSKEERGVFIIDTSTKKAEFVPI